MMKSVRLGIVGVGGIGSAHLNCIASGKIDGMSLGAVCDIDPSRIDYAKKVAPGVSAFDDCREMFKSGKIDAALISVPHPLHAEIAVSAFEAGLHVLVEKPEDISVSAARRLNAAAEASKKVFAIMFNQRTNPVFKQAREIVLSGRLGELKRSVWIITNWYRTQHYYDSGSWRATWSGEGGGVLLNQAPHNLDLWQWICGMPEEITAFCDIGKYHRIEVEDDATIFARYKNGATGVFIASTGELPGTNRLEISGTRGSLVVEQGRAVFRRLGFDEREICRSSSESCPSSDHETVVYQPKGQGSAHAGIIQNFCNAILYNEPLISPGAEGINELTISNAAYLSSWTNSAVRLPFDEELFDRLLDERRSASTVKSADGIQTHRDYSERWQVRF